MAKQAYSGLVVDALATLCDEFTVRFHVSLHIESVTILGTKR